ncbi:hypothetical protein Dimus_030184 [Dionaea muscipula]
MGRGGGRSGGRGSRDIGPQGGDLTAFDYDRGDNHSPIFYDAIEQHDIEEDPTAENEASSSPNEDEVDAPIQQSSPALGRGHRIPQQSTRL